jgi:hypothetical protein
METEIWTYHPKEKVGEAYYALPWKVNFYASLRSALNNQRIGDHIV